MPFNCLRTDINEKICSLDYSYESFLDLKKDYRDNRNLLKCTDCGNRMIPVESTAYNNRWFRHEPDSDYESTCRLPSPQKRHRYMISYIYRYLKDLGFDVKTEETLSCEDGGYRIPDIYCENDGDPFSIEIQLSSLPDDEYIERTNSYYSCGIQHILWIGIKKNINLSRTIPYIFLCHQNKDPIKVSDIDHILEEDQEFHSRVLVPGLRYGTRGDFYNPTEPKLDSNLQACDYYKLFPLLPIIKKFVYLDIEWKFCDFGLSDDHWCNRKRCNKLYDQWNEFWSKQRKAESEKDRLERIEKERQEAEEEKRQKQAVFDRECKRVRWRKQRILEAVREDNKLKKLERIEEDQASIKKQKRLDLIESLVDSPSLYTCGIDKEDHSLYCYIYDLGLKKILKEQYIKEGSPIPWDEDTQILLREYVLSGGDYLDPEGYKEYGISI